MVPMAAKPGLAETTQLRPYRGVDSAARLAERRRRLLSAGLDLLGSDHAREVTVRGARVIPALEQPEQLADIVTEFWSMNADVRRARR